jgi:threonine dehydratase
VLIPEKLDILKIAENIKPYIHRTPVLSSGTINEMFNSSLCFKCENFQKTGSFKIRGAMNAILYFNEEERAQGVVTHSSGNFAQALAYAALQRRIKSRIVMPENVIPSKRDAVLGYGAEIIYSGSKPLDRENKCDEVIRETGSVFIHPSNDIRVISGHSSCAVEFINDAEDLDYVLVPVGGGGLASGICIGFHHFSPKTKVIGVEPKNADDAYRSLKENKIIPQTNPGTIADGLKTSLGDITFHVLKKYLHEIITVTEEEIISAMKLIWERLKIVAEPSGAVSFAAVLQNNPKFRSKKIGVILSGGNVDLTSILSLMETK